MSRDTDSIKQAKRSTAVKPKIGSLLLFLAMLGELIAEACDALLEPSQAGTHVYSVAISQVC